MHNFSWVRKYLETLLMSMHCNMVTTIRWNFNFGVLYYLQQLVYNEY
jgi:hypothetical protein